MRAVHTVQEASERVSESDLCCIFLFFSEPCFWVHLVFLLSRPHPLSLSLSLCDRLNFCASWRYCFAPACSLSLSLWMDGWMDGWERTGTRVHRAYWPACLPAHLSANCSGLIHTRALTHTASKQASKQGSKSTRAGEAERMSKECSMYQSSRSCLGWPAGRIIFLLLVGQPCVSSTYLWAGRHT